MSTAPVSTWAEDNQRGLVCELARIRAALVRHAERNDGRAEVGENTQPEDPPASRSATRRVRKVSVEGQATSAALENLCAIFSLSPFERDVLLLCAGIELDSAFAVECGAASGDPRKAYPTFSLALAALPEPHWSALLPVAPLRRWRLVEFGTGDSLTVSPLRIDERILHYLTGLSYLDERLRGLVEPVSLSGEVPPSHREIAEQIAELWRVSEITNGVQLFGKEERACRDVAAAACAMLGVQVYAVRVGEIPTAPAEREAFIRLWQRETLLGNCALLVDCSRVSDHHAVADVIERLPGPLIVVGRDPLQGLSGASIKFEVRKPAVAEQHQIWREALGPVAEQLNGELELVNSHFDLDTHSIRAAGAELNARFATAKDDAGAALWDACRNQSRQRLDGLAQRIEPAATWDDLVVPEPQRQTLREMALQVRQRAVVYERWGFAKKGARGLGISALFAGASGTGKTMAAEVLAHELRLDLFRIDLSSVVSKYIGETEKNLARLFDAAECGNAILLFDEADALFGKRSEVKDSHDRYANIEVSYLLQRMEAYRGLAILTTNMKQALDTGLSAANPVRRAIPLSRCRDARRNLASHFPAERANRRPRPEQARAPQRGRGQHPQHRHQRRFPRRRLRRTGAHGSSATQRARRMCEDRKAAQQRRNGRVGMNFEIRIEELVLHGFDSIESHRIGDALGRELERLFNEIHRQPEFATDTQIERLDCGNFLVQSPAKPESVGEKIAQTVHLGIIR